MVHIKFLKFLKLDVRERLHPYFFALAMICLFISHASDGAVDTLKFHYSASVFADAENQDFFNPEISWKRKYKDWDGGDKRAAFIGSTTIFVFITDAFHLFKFFRINLMHLSILIAFITFIRLRWLHIFILFALIKIISWAGFHLFYTYLLV